MFLYTYYFSLIEKKLKQGGFAGKMAQEGIDQLRTI